MAAEASVRLFERIDRELWVVTAAAWGRRGGLIATFVSQASIVPEMPRVLVGLAKHHHSWQLVEKSRAFALHLIGEDQLDWVWRFGLRSGRDGDKLDGLTIETGPTGSPILTDAPGWLDCRVEKSIDTGDRTIYLAEVVASRLSSDRALLTVAQLRQRADAERRVEMTHQRESDSILDAEAIREWRRRAAGLV